MTPFLLYGLKVTLLLLVFGGFYHGVLARTSLGHFKRAYLLLALVFAHLFPWLPVREVPGPAAAVVSRVTPAPIAGITPVAAGVPEAVIVRDESGSGLTVGQLLGLVYLGGLCFAGRRFVRSIRLLVRQARRGRRQRYGRAYRIELPGCVTPHTFGRWIFTGAANPPAPAILAHEYAHVTEWHTLDRLFLAVLRTLCWCNPLLYYYERAIIFNHEYLADRAVLRHGFAPRDYQYELLAALGRRSANTRLASGADFHFTKKRLQMMLLPAASPARTTFVWSLTLALGLALLWSFGRTAVVPGTSPARAASATASATVPPPVFSIREREHRRPTAGQLSAWLDADVYGVWIDGKRVDNAELERYVPEDFSYHTVSRLTRNARNYGALDYEVELTTNAVFQRNRYTPSWQSSSCRWEPAPAKEDC